MTRYSTIRRLRILGTAVVAEDVRLARAVRQRRHSGGAVQAPAMP